jgi:hypothetical protein
MGGNGGRRWVIMAGERPAVGRGWWVCNGWRWVKKALRSNVKLDVRT